MASATATRMPRCATPRSLAGRGLLSMVLTTGPTPARRRAGGTGGRPSRRTAARRRSSTTSSRGTRLGTRRLAPLGGRSREASVRPTVEVSERGPVPSGAGRVTPSPIAGTAPTPSGTRAPPFAVLAARRAATSACTSRTASGVPTCPGVVVPVAAARTTRGAATLAVVAPSGRAKRGVGPASSAATASRGVVPTTVALTTFGPRTREVATGPLAAIAATGAARRPRTGGAVGRTGAGAPVAPCTGRARATTGRTTAPGRASTLAAARAVVKRRRLAVALRPPVSVGRSPTQGPCGPRTGQTAGHSRMAVERPGARTTGSLPRTGRPPPPRAAAPRLGRGVTARSGGRPALNCGPFVGLVAVRGTRRITWVRAALPCAAGVPLAPLRGSDTAITVGATRTEKEIRATRVASSPDCH